MPVPFGFSVGDFVNVLNLFKEIGVALKDHGGASEDYQKTLQHLNAVHAVLLQLQTFESSTGSLTQINAIRGQAQLVQHEVEEFLKKIEKYRSTLGPHVGKKFYRGMLPKIKWSQYAVRQVESLRTRIEIQLSNIHVLLGLHHSDATSQIYGGQLEFRDDVRRITEKNSEVLKNCQLEAKRTQLSVQQAASSTQSQMVTCSDNLIDRMNGLDKTIRDKLAGHPLDQITTGAKYFADAQVRFDIGVDQLEKYHNKIALSMQKLTARDTDLLELKDMLAHHLKETQLSQASNRDSNEIARILLILSIPRFNITKRDLQILLRHLSAEVETVLRLSFASFFVFLKDLVLALPQIVLIYKILQRLPQAICVTLHDNMTFEDALGRVQSLQYQQFKHWAVFEASLLCAFANTPGMKKVVDGHFVLTSPAAVGTLTASNWTQMVKPGLEIRMSIIIRTMNTAAGQCPRGCTVAENVVSDGEICCTHCGLYYQSRHNDRRESFAKYSSTRAPVDDNLDITGAEQSSNGAARGLAITPPLATERKDNADHHSQDNYRPTNPDLNTSAVGTNGTPVRGAGPIHYEKWFQDRRVESEEIKVMKRVHLDHRDFDMMGRWPSENWTTSSSTFVESHSVDRKLASRSKLPTTTERRKRPKDKSHLPQAEPSFKLITHDSPKTLTCHVCLKRFSRKAVLNAHQMSHDLTCLQCGLKSETIAAYEAHRSFHQGELEERLNVVQSVPTNTALALSPEELDRYLMECEALISSKPRATSSSQPTHPNRALAGRVVRSLRVIELDVSANTLTWFGSGTMNFICLGCGSSFFLPDYERHQCRLEDTRYYVSELLVESIPPSMFKSDVVYLFDKYGDVESCAVMRDDRYEVDGKLAYVKMANYEQAHAAMQGIFMQGLTLRIQKARHVRWSSARNSPWVEVGVKILAFAEHQY